MSGSTLPLIMTLAGPQPTPVTTIQNTTIANATALSPGLTANLPGSMIEDMTDTSVGAIVQADLARVDAINSVTPLGANPFILAAQGVMLGIPQGLQANTSVAVVFTATSGGSAAAGLVIPAGTLVGDGSYQYATQTSVTTQSDGITQQVAAVATQSGTWSVGAGAVNAVATSMPTGFTVTVTNPSAGVPGVAAQTVPSYRAQIVAAEQVTCQGTGGYITALLSAIPGVQSRLILVAAVSGALKVICGLTVDQNLIAGAIYNGVADVSTLRGSQLAITAISAATDAVITTNYNSAVAVGTVLTVTGATPTAYNTTYTVTGVSGTAITTSTNSSGFGSYTSGAMFNPNPRDVTTTITDGANTYSIPFVNPPNQVVTGTATWATNLPSFASISQVNQLATVALAAYINGIQAGQPINLLEMTAEFQTAVASVLPIQNISALTFVIDINGVTVSPSAGTSIIPGDPESFFSAAANAFAVSG